MTDDEARALGQRLVACKGFRWMRGMRVAGFRDGASAQSFDADGVYVYYAHAGEVWSFDPDLRPELWPDLRGPATRGCVLELIREAYNDHTYAACKDGDDAEALVAALESAP